MDGGMPLLRLSHACVLRVSSGRQPEGRSVYNSYPSVEETEGKLARVRGLTRSGLFYLMYWVCGETRPSPARQCARQCA